MSPGKRRSSALVLRRWLALLGRLLRGGARREDLLAAVEETVGPDAFLGQPDRSLEYDLRCLRERWQVGLEYDRAGQTYHLTELPFPLLDLPDEDLAALAFLYHNFPPDAPHGQQVRQLLDHLVSLLPDGRRREVLRLRTIPDLELEVLDQEEIPPDVWSAVERATVERRQLSFTYRPAKREEGEPLERRHNIEPYSVEFREGHYYLEGYCLRMRVGQQERPHVGTLCYRLSRIVPGTAQVLPAKVPPGRRPARTYRIRYRLGPPIARGGVTERFPNTRVHPLPDGSAEVEAETADLWRARQKLLRYGEHCRVLAPDELVHMMRESIARMHRVYGLDAQDLSP